MQGRNIHPWWQQHVAEAASLPVSRGDQQLLARAGSAAIKQSPEQVYVRYSDKHHLLRDGPSAPDSGWHSKPKWTSHDPNHRSRRFKGIRTWAFWQNTESKGKSVIRSIPWLRQSYQYESLKKFINGNFSLGFCTISTLELPVTENPTQNDQSKWWVMRWYQLQSGVDKMTWQATFSKLAALVYSILHVSLTVCRKQPSILPRNLREPVTQSHTDV